MSDEQTDMLREVREWAENVQELRASCLKEAERLTARLAGQAGMLRALADELESVKPR